MAKLYFYYSAMNAGKTTTLLQSEFNYRERGMHTVLFTPALDNRYQVGKITSRLGLQQDAITFNTTFSFTDHLEQRLRDQKPIHCVLVDEAQFLNEKQVYQLTEVVDQMKIPVLTYGLRTNFLGQPFEGSRALLAWADEIVEIKTICHCGRKATMNRHKTIDPDTDPHSIDTIDIGGNDKYLSVCRLHFKGPLES